MVRRSSTRQRRRVAPHWTADRRRPETGYRIEERGLEFRSTDEFACHRNEYQDEIAASEGIAMALLTADHPPLRIEKRRGPFPIAVNQIENEVFHRNEVRIEI